MIPISITSERDNATSHRQKGTSLASVVPTERARKKPRKIVAQPALRWQTLTVIYYRSTIFN